MRIIFGFYLTFFAYKLFSKNSMGFNQKYMLKRTSEFQRNLLGKRQFQTIFALYFGMHVEKAVPIENKETNSEYWFQNGQAEYWLKHAIEIIFDKLQLEIMMVAQNHQNGDFRDRKNGASLKAY